MTSSARAPDLKRTRELRGPSTGPFQHFRQTAVTPLVVMARNAFNVFRQQITGRRMADVAHAENPDHPPAFVDHRQSAYFQRLHVPHGLGEVVVLPAAMDALKVR